MSSTVLVAPPLVVPEPALPAFAPVPPAPVPALLLVPEISLTPQTAGRSLRTTVTPVRPTGSVA